MKIMTSQLCDYLWRHNCQFIALHSPAACSHLARLGRAGVAGSLHSPLATSHPLVVVVVPSCWRRIEGAKWVARRLVGKGEPRWGVVRRAVVCVCGRPGWFVRVWAASGGPCSTKFVTMVNKMVIVNKREVPDELHVESSIQESDLELRKAKFNIKSKSKLNFDFNSK